MVSKLLLTTVVTALLAGSVKAICPGYNYGIAMTGTDGSVSGSGSGSAAAAQWQRQRQRQWQRQRQRQWQWQRQRQGSAATAAMAMQCRGSGKLPRDDASQKVDIWQVFDGSCNVLNSVTSNTPCTNGPFECGASATTFTGLNLNGMNYACHADSNAGSCDGHAIQFCIRRARVHFLFQSRWPGVGQRDIGNMNITIGAMVQVPSMLKSGTLIFIPIYLVLSNLSQKYPHWPESVAASRAMSRDMFSGSGTIEMPVEAENVAGANVPSMPSSGPLCATGVFGVLRVSSYIPVSWPDTAVTVRLAQSKRRSGSREMGDPPGVESAQTNQRTFTRQQMIRVPRWRFVGSRSILHRCAVNQRI
ncbi:hypothetical protein BU15DRAFT_62705 [Melanogaster broomeanus]|nr:hypothetical protein BU15DRAFT_62705 [Melanogaster broomeanus]